MFVHASISSSRLRSDSRLDFDGICSLVGRPASAALMRQRRHSWPERQSTGGAPDDGLESIYWYTIKESLTDLADMNILRETLEHARAAFEDWPERERRRHLLRLWPDKPGFRSLGPGTAEGRQGVAAQVGKVPSYAGAVGQGRIATK
jgi:hypothetical protein